MNETVSEWVEKANGDFEVAKLVLESQPRPHCDAVCFHCQQCVEKLIKAVLLHHNTKPPRIHDLLLLSNQLRPLASAWAPQDKELRFLTQGANLFRYPGETATLEKARIAFSVCTRMRLQLLGLIEGDGAELKP